MKAIPLIIIDVQNAFLDPSWGKRNNPEAEARIVELLEHWRAKSRPVIFIQHDSENPKSLFYPGTETHPFMECTKPIVGELIINKKVNSAFIGTELETVLKQLDCSNVVIVGLTTNHCVETTTRMAGNLGFNPILVTDACATFERKGMDGKIYPPEWIHEITMVNLNGEFAEIMRTQDVLNL